VCYYCQYDVPWQQRSTPLTQALDSLIIEDLLPIRWPIKSGPVMDERLDFACLSTNNLYIPHTTTAQPSICDTAAVQQYVGAHKGGDSAFSHLDSNASPVTARLGSVRIFLGDAVVIEDHPLGTARKDCQLTTTNISGGTAKGHAPHCTPRTSEFALLHAPRSTRLDEISLRPAAHIGVAFGPFDPPGTSRGPLQASHFAQIFLNVPLWGTAGRPPAPAGRAQSARAPPPPPTLPTPPPQRLGAILPGC
jgi:hypothetical protein